LRHIYAVSALRNAVGVFEVECDRPKIPTGVLRLSLRLCDEVIEVRTGEQIYDGTKLS
jgi:hypothetical protein